MFNKSSVELNNRRIGIITAKAGCWAVPSNEAEMPIELDRLAEEL